MSTPAEPTYLGLTIANWIAAVMPLLGLLGGWLFWYLPGFRPQIKTLIDGQGQRIKVTIRNRGRAEGSIESVSFIRNDESGDQIAQDYIWHGEGLYSAPLSGNGTLQFVAQSEAPTFADGTLVRVTANGKVTTKLPKRMGADVSWDLNDVLPAR